MTQTFNQIRQETFVVYKALQANPSSPELQAQWQLQAVKFANAEYEILTAEEANLPKD